MATANSWHPRFAHLQWAGLAAWVGLLVGSCAHNWDDWLPGGGFTGSGGGATTTTTASFGGGGWGGGAIDGECPADNVGAPQLVRVPTPQRVAVCIGKTEVTRDQYRAFVDDVQANGGTVGGGYEEVAVCSWNDPVTEPTALHPAQDWPPNGVRLPNPVAFVDWCDALAFCMHYGQRLCGTVETGATVPNNGFTNPSVSEWFSACTNAGATQFPYGGSYQQGICRGDEPASGPAPVGTLPGCKNAAGVLDLSGNLWEWENACVGTNGETDTCRQRGGGYQTAPSELSCSAESSYPRGEPSVVVGFRCCADPILSEVDAGTDADAQVDTGAGGSGGSGGGSGGN